MSTPTNEKFIRIDVWTANVFFKPAASIGAPQDTPRKLVEEYMNHQYGTGNWDSRTLKKSTTKVKRAKLSDTYHVLELRLQNLTETDKMELAHLDVTSGKCPLRVWFPHQADAGKIVHIQVETQDFDKLDIRRTILRVTDEGRVVFNEGDVFDLDFFYSANQPHIRTSAKIQIECEVYKTAPIQ